LFWGTGLLVVFRWRHFIADSVGVVLFASLALLVVGTILLLDYLGTGCRKTLLAVGPGVFVTIFLVLPSCHFTGISVYLLLFLPAVSFLWYKHYRVQRPSVVDDSEGDLEAPAATEWDENVQMRLLRRKESDETELLEAWVRADFQPSERLVIIHVPFCPSFAEQPKWEACQFEGDDVEIQVSQINPLGARIDLKRPSQRENQESVGIFFAVRCFG